MSQPLVSVIVCTHLESNRKYLNACLESLRVQEGVDFEVILMSSAPHPEVFGVPNLKQYECEGDMGWTLKINKGVELSDPRSKYLMFLNDDVILSKHAIATMARNCADYAVIANPLSNCDNGWIYNAVFELRSGGRIMSLDKRFYEFEEIDGFQAGIHNYPRGQRIWINANYLCFYATMIPRAIWNQVGILDVNYVNGYEDQDFCLRAQKLGVATVVDAEAFIFHFGGATTESTSTQELRKYNEDYFKSKWGTK
jgi:GT2 family glycosyltransferase